MIKVTANTVFDILLRLRDYFQVDTAFRNYGKEAPIRSELYNSEQMEKHGKILARSHNLQQQAASDQLLKRLEDNERVLLEVRNLLAESIRSGKTVTPGAEWLLDNFYLIEEQILIARKHLPKGYSEDLPYLAEGISAGMPRVYDIVLEIIAHSDGQVDIKSLSTFIAAYQTATTLTLGELWALPIMLRLGVIENLRRVSGKIALDMIDHNLADYWADRMTTTIKEAPGNLILTIADMARSKPVLTGPFVAGFTRKLQGRGPALALALNWMEQQLSEADRSSNDLIQQESQKQAADQVSVSNSIGTLRLLGITDWREFVEKLSSVEQLLRKDRTGIYPLMDFATRDRYRHVVETLAKASPLSEPEVARKILELTARHPSADNRHKAQEHIGYYLVDKGLAQAEQAVQFRPTFWQTCRRKAGKMPVTLYLSSIIILSLLLSTVAFSLAYLNGTEGWTLWLVSLLSFSGAIQLAIALVNWCVTVLVRPQLLPRMDFSKGIPAEYQTLVVVPALISDRRDIEELVEALEIRYLANREPHLHFGLLTDFKDADHETLPGEEALLSLAQDHIIALNQKYKQTEDLFFLFHRPRTWNPRERKWMGYERKRGKLAALNALLRQHGRHDFSLITGDYHILTRSKYVLTLDADTQLPREAAWKIIATMAHPLNHAVYDVKKRRVTSGYGILQPRVAPAIPKTAPSHYLRLQGNIAGIDPYTRISSDVYQDLFGEGSFIGKGIYDIDIFEQALHGVFPENRILSHDLLEGCYTRSGLISDVLLYEENPAQYGADIKRRHRWTRGDWQIGAWMLPFVTLASGRLSSNPLSALSKWKIADNLRRSVAPLGLLLLLLTGWFALPFPWFWTLAATFILLLPVLTATGWQMLHKPVDLTINAHLSETSTTVRDTLLRFIFDMAVLPYEVYKNMDAIVRTNWRMIVTQRKLLEWTPSAYAFRNIQPGIGATYAAMWIAPLLGITCGYLLLTSKPESFYTALPILTLWLLAPALAWRISLQEREQKQELPKEQMLFLHKTARKTWSFFEQFVTAAENWLPPDNYQEQPIAVIAHRTSPTNMGLALLANLSAYDFGYISGGALIDRSQQTLQTMQTLERYKGHFYNWYDTLTLLPLNPRYVSTVDSGNLAGHLLTLRQGLLAMPEQPLINSRIYEGLLTTVKIIQEHSTGEEIPLTEKLLTVLQNAVREQPSTLAGVKRYLDEIIALARELKTHLPEADADLYLWGDHLLEQGQSIHDDLIQLAPWLAIQPVPEQLTQLTLPDEIPSLLSHLAAIEQLIPLLDHYDQQEQSAATKEWLSKMRACLDTAADAVRERRTQLQQLAAYCEQFSDVAYDFLYERSTNLLRIGYNVSEHRKDNSYYDLLASEVRLGVFVAIAQGKLPQESWFALGRLLTNSGGDPILLSWSGSMFEYLMPQLVMPSYERTLLQQTSKASVKRQIEYGGQRGIPWGISESGYNRVDANLNYQYRAFGVPGLGLKRGLEEDLVVAPYASMLALMVMPGKACSNLQLLAAAGFEGRFGFYEAIDYTSSRLPRGEHHSIIPSYMVHHQGMGFLSLAYVLLDKKMQERFESELRFQATLLLLQERIPRAIPFYTHTADLIETHSIGTSIPVRNISTPHTRIPEIQLLCNGRYHIMITNSGGGYSRWKDISVTRWREDATQDNRGIFCYIKDVHSGKFWSNTYQPTLHPTKDYEVLFSQDHIAFLRKDYGIETKTEIVISPEDDIEVRRIRLTNKGQSTSVLELTSYAEVVMASQPSDELHPAFSNLFVQTTIQKEHQAIFCTRRPRSQEETPPWMFHHMSVHDVAVEAISYETDRNQFIGRGRNLAFPKAMTEDTLSDSEGPVLDPVLSIRYRITLKPGQTATVALIYGIHERKEGCENLMHKYRDQNLKKRAFELSWTHSQVLLRQINATEADAQLYDRLASSVIYANPELRAEGAVIRSNLRGQSGLWSHSVSGDLPIVLLQLNDPDRIDLARQMIQAHAYWRLKGLAVDLVIWNEDHGSYRQVLQDQILGLIHAEAGSNPAQNNAGHIFVKSVDQISTEDRVLFESVARIIIRDNDGTLSEQLSRHYTEKSGPPLLEPQADSTTHNNLTQLSLPDNLLFFNGSGGFTPDGTAYKIMTSDDITTPAPWVNVIANPQLGTVISESGSSYTWAINAHEYRITPWSNDPVSDGGGEAFYLRDEESGHFWSPAPFPAKGPAPYITTHGFGYTIIEHSEQGISSELFVFVDKVAPVKFVVLKVKNTSGRERKLSATGYLEMILGDVRAKTNMHIHSEQDAATGALLSRNRYNYAFADRVAFFKVNEAHPGFTTDRSEFIGRNRNLGDPQAMYSKKLSDKQSTGTDPCTALQVKFDLLNGAEREIIFQIGNEIDTASALSLIRRFTDRDAVLQSFKEVKKYWVDVVTTVQVTTPDPALNILANGWLTYQTMACRLFGRSGFYQSGGAFGFRDQLQDVLALLYTQPELAREQILLSASRQFSEGDVQHWWHPPEGRGVRTHCSDDLLWLPFVVSRYIEATGDTDILGTKIGFLECRLLHQDEESLYDLPVSGHLYGSLYEHCSLAIRYSLRFGKHGLPLIGTGDWNDGMDKVGHKGEGESIWLGFFLYDVLMRFADTALHSGDTVFSETCTREAERLRTDIETSGWDGQWYLRAYFDNGTPLGSRENKECRIDAIAQSWSVLSGAADDRRKAMAMASLDKHLVKRDMGLIQLLDPPFNGMGLNPGYIQGYVPGVRENGGQYSHAAIWAIMAFAALGERDKVWELFSMIHPINHSSDAAAVLTYKVEPYVMAADVYANPEHEGRGGWTWYTGSAGWMYQLITGSLLGMNLTLDHLIFRPCFPLTWPSVSIVYRYKNTVYRITVFQIEDNEPSWWKIDSKQGKGNALPLHADGKEHVAEVHVGKLRLQTAGL